MTPTEQQPFIYSEFGGDLEMTPLVEMFVEEMPDRIETLINAYAANDMELLKRIAHQMKGAVGSYGFDQLTPYAESVERAVRENWDASETEQAIENLVANCQRIRSGEPS